MASDLIERRIKDYFGPRLREHGTTPKGVDWNNQDAQYLRFNQIMKVCETDAPFTLNDYGCGYGALVGFLTEGGYSFTYWGYDVTDDMTQKAESLYGGLPHVKFVNDESLLPVCDYTVASGVFNERFDVDEEDWQHYVLESLGKMAAKSKLGFASTFLTKYSDAEKMRSDLYYPDPCFMLDYCIRHFSKNVAVLHDYRAWDFTVIVRL